MAELSDALRQMQQISAKLAQSAESNFRISDKLSRSRQEMVLKALQALKPIIILELKKSWELSGMPKGALYEAAILNPNIQVSLKGIHIGLSAGIPPLPNPSGKSTYSIYAQAGAKQYGSVRGGNLTAKTKKFVKDKTVKIAGAHRISAHPFYNVTPGMIDALSAEFKRLMQIQIAEAANG